MSWVVLRRCMAAILIGLLIAVAIFVAFNWRTTANLVVTWGKPVAQTDHLYPLQHVAACEARALEPGTGVPPGTFAALKSYSDQHGGLSLLVMLDGSLVYEDYAKGITAKTPLQTFSMNKTVTALMVGIAQRDGLIGSIDAPIGDWLPEWNDDDRGRITMRQLLTMTSGLKNHSMIAGEWPAIEMLLSDEIEKTAIETPLTQPPGAAFRYKNVDAQIAGAVLRRALDRNGDGETYADYLSRTLWCGAGNEPATLWAEAVDGAPRFYAGLQASTHDWARLGQLILDRGVVDGRQVVPAEWIDAMGAPSARNPNYGLFLWRGSPWNMQRQYSPEAGMTALHSAAYLADDVVFMDGYGGERVYIVPSVGLVIVRMGEPDRAFDDAPLVNLALAALKDRR